jgi:hypothetical protein
MTHVRGSRDNILYMLEISPTILCPASLLVPHSITTYRNGRGARVALYVYPIEVTKQEITLVREE